MQIKSHIAADLRRRPDDPSQLEEALDAERVTVEMMRRLTQDDPCELNLGHLGRELSRLADHLLLAEEPGEALPLKEEAVDIWRRLGRKKACFLAELDASEMIFELGRHEQALDELDRLVDLSSDQPYAVYRDFALEVRGRCLARTGDAKRARDDLEDALALRRERGNTRQIEQTERLLGLLSASGD